MNWMHEHAKGGRCRACGETYPQALQLHLIRRHKAAYQRGLEALRQLREEDLRMTSMHIRDRTRE